MSRLFGEIRQIGIVVRDIEKAMAHWADVCGIGPWFYVDKLPITSFRYCGQLVDDFHISVALANSGALQLELIQQRGDGPSMYQDFLAAGHEGMQHWSSWPKDYDRRLQNALANGYEIGQQGESPRGRFVYLYDEGHPRTVIEMAELTAERQAIFGAIEAASVDWDGQDPIRRTWPTG